MSTPVRLIFIVLAAVGVSSCAAKATFEFTARDAVSKAWVWDLTARIENRASLSFFQSDAGPVPQRFTRLAPGDQTLLLSAPGYQPQAIPIHLAPGANTLSRPVEMVGLEIPNLDHWIIFESSGSQGIVCELRPVGTDGKAVVNHPCMELWIGCRVSVEVKNGLPVRQETGSEAARGKELFKGQIPWKWDATPETLYRYGALIPGAKIQDDPSPYRVIDYLIVEPDPLQISKPDLDALMAGVWNLPDMSSITSALEREKGRLRFFLTTSRNVKGAGQ
ncbi:MAG: hypothetical protein ABSG17_12395 [Spirochaetia bacterium]|jgi:hypothetical protein